MATNLNSVVETYVKLRDAKKVLDDKHKENTATLNATLVKLEAVLLAEFNAAGVDNVKTAAGTAFKKVMTSARVADWDSTLVWVIQHERWDMLKRDVAKSAVESYKDETAGLLPPGIDWREEIVVQVRRA